MFADEAHQSVEGSAKRVQQLIGSGMILSEFFKHCAGRLVRFQFLRNLLEMLLILVQVGPGNLQQLIQWKVHHFIVFELL